MKQEEKQDSIDQISEEVQYIQRLFDRGVLKTQVLKNVIDILGNGFKEVEGNEDYYNPIFQPVKLEKPDIVLGKNQEGVLPIEASVVDGFLCAKMRIDSLYYRLKLLETGTLLVCQTAKTWNPILLRMDVDRIDLPFEERNEK